MYKHGNRLASVLKTRRLVASLLPVCVLAGFNPSASGFFYQVNWFENGEVKFESQNGNYIVEELGVFRGSTPLFCDNSDHSSSVTFSGPCFARCKGLGGVFYRFGAKAVIITDAVGHSAIRFY